jgi:hypothetical protein
LTALRVTSFIAKHEVLWCQRYSCRGVSFASVSNSCHGQPHVTSVEKNDDDDDDDADDADDENDDDDDDDDEDNDDGFDDDDDDDDADALV